MASQKKKNKPHQLRWKGAGVITSSQKKGVVEMTYLQNGGVCLDRLTPLDNEIPQYNPLPDSLTRKREYYKRHLDTYVNGLLEPEFIGKSYAGLVELIRKEPTRVREVVRIVSKLIFITDQIISEQAEFNRDLIKYLETLPQKVKIITE